jgi:hypothetical protein
MKNFIKGIFLTLAACSPQVSHATLQNQTYVENCLIPKNSVEFKVFNKHTRNNNAQSISQQIRTITTNNTTEQVFQPSITQQLLWKRAYDKLVEEPTISSGIKFTVGCVTPYAFMLGDMREGATRLFTHHKYDHLPAADQQVTETAQQLCPLLGIDPTSISVKFNKKEDSAGANSFSKVILVGPNFMMNEPIYQQRATLKHELTHIKYDDTRSRCIAEIVTPPVTTAVSLCSALAITKFSQWAQQKARANGWNRSAYYIRETAKRTSEILQRPWFHYFMSKFIQAKYSQFQEKRADLYMIKETQTARGLSDSFKESLQKNPGLRFIQKLSFDAAHPTHEERIKYLEPYVQQEK